MSINQGKDKVKDYDVFPVGVVEHSGRAYWTWKIGWMLVALLAVLSLGTAVVFLTPSVLNLTESNSELELEVASLQRASSVGQERSECRNRYSLVIENARIQNTLAQNAFVISLASTFHGETIDDVKANLESTNLVLISALADLNTYESEGAPVPCPLPVTPN